MHFRNLQREDLDTVWTKIDYLEIIKYGHAILCNFLGVSTKTIIGPSEVSSIILVAFFLSLFHYPWERGTPSAQAEILVIFGCQSTKNAQRGVRSQRLPSSWNILIFFIEGSVWPILLYLLWTKHVRINYKCTGMCILSKFVVAFLGWFVWCDSSTNYKYWQVCNWVQWSLNVWTHWMYRIQIISYVFV